MSYYVYEYLLLENNRGVVRAVVHKADCRWCNDGQGHPQNAGKRAGLRRWHGPYKTIAQARNAARQIGGKALACGHCLPA
jgi:hypothetical protein